MTDNYDIPIKNYYQLLNVSKNANTDDIEKAKKKLYKHYHPDKQHDPLMADQARQSWNLIQEAYSTLIDERLRLVYDRLGLDGVDRARDLLVWQPGLLNPRQVLKMVQQQIALEAEATEYRQTKSAGLLELSCSAADWYDVVSGRTMLPYVSALQMQHSVDTPMSAIDTLTLGGGVIAQKGTGQGQFFAQWTRQLAADWTVYGRTTASEQLSGVYAGVQTQVARGTGVDLSCGYTSDGVDYRLGLTQQVTEHVRFHCQLNVGVSQQLHGALVYSTAPQDHLLSDATASSTRTSGNHPSSSSSSSAAGDNDPSTGPDDDGGDEREKRRRSGGGSGDPLFPGLTVEPSREYKLELTQSLGDLELALVCDHPLSNNVSLETRIALSRSRGPSTSVGAHYQLDRHTGLSLAVDHSWLGLSIVPRVQRTGHRFVFPVLVFDPASVATSSQSQTSVAALSLLLPLGVFALLELTVFRPLAVRAQVRRLQETEAARDQYREKAKQQRQLAIDNMRQSVQNIVRSEQRKAGGGGLIIRHAVYGLLNDTILAQLTERQRKEVQIDVTIPLQMQVEQSTLKLPNEASKCTLDGFYDPCISEEKQLLIVYSFKGIWRKVIFDDFDAVMLPKASHQEIDQDEIADYASPPEFGSTAATSSTSNYNEIDD